MAEPERDDTVVRRAMEDPEFRERLLSDPVSAIEEAVGMSVPDDVEIIVVENGPKTFHLVLPPADVTLEQMDAFVGGSLFNREGPRIRPGGWQPRLDWD
ncbi:MAG TPA: NHLP leader peptide family RiPP precursor [Candidatus Nanopelagicales bacterium]|nr:NHLP leader peptide family RiPP precursor [Candidatus Nanopelagicales bacterium]